MTTLLTVVSAAILALILIVGVIRLSGWLTDRKVGIEPLDRSSSSPTAEHGSGATFVSGDGGGGGD